MAQHACSKAFNSICNLLVNRLKAPSTRCEIGGDYLPGSLPFDVGTPGGWLVWEAGKLLFSILSNGVTRLTDIAHELSIELLTPEALA